MSPALTLQTINERLNSCTGWEAKSRMLVQLSREIPVFADVDRTDKNRIAGCDSQVWLTLSWHNGLLELAADSDSRMIKGLLTLVFAAYHQRAPQESLDFDFDGWLAGMGLSRFLTASRSNGLKTIVTHIRTAAEQSIPK